MVKCTLAVITAIAVLVAGCSASDDSRTASSQQVQIDTNPTVMLSPVDSIGIELGDSNYVMGGVEGVDFGPDGNIAVLDCGRSTVLLYSPRGEYLRNIGRRGNGPGELQKITFMAVSEDGNIHLSGTGSDMLGLHSYDYYTGEWLGSSRTFVPPSCLEGAGGNSYLRKDINFEVNGDEIVLPITISMYETGIDDPIVTYLEEIVPFDPTDDVSEEPDEEEEDEYDKLDCDTAMTPEQMEEHSDAIDAWLAAGSPE